MKEPLPKDVRIHDELKSKDVLIRDPLSDVTRKERKFLMGVSIVGITIVKAGLVPSKISALGIEFQPVHQNSLLTILALINLYFLVAFVIYSVSDFLSWRIAYIDKIRMLLHGRAKSDMLNQERIEAMKKTLKLTAPIDWENDREIALQEKQLIANYEKKLYDKLGNRAIFALSNPISVIRAIFEFVLPILFGIYVVLLLLNTQIFISGN